MGAGRRFVIPLLEVTDRDEQLVGGKAARLAVLARAGFAVPGVLSYRRSVRAIRGRLPSG